MTQKNILFITVDCWRGDHVDYVNPSLSTPNLEKLVKRSTAFVNAQSCAGWTKPAMTALMSSTYPSMYEFCEGKLSDQRLLLAEHLSTLGYETVGITSNPVCGTMSGFNRGFDQFNESRPPSFQRSLLYRILGHWRCWRLVESRLFHAFISLFRTNLAPQQPTLDAQTVTDHGIKALKSRSDTPQFLWLHYMDLHWPYNSSLRKRTFDEVRRMWRDRRLFKRVRSTKGTYFPGLETAERWKTLYAEENEYLDQHLGRLFDFLKDTENLDNTIIILTGDHGEELYEHGTWAHSYNQLHREGVNVPLIIHDPDKSGSVLVDEPVSHIDVVPTLLSLLGLKKPDQMLGQTLNVSKGGSLGKVSPTYTEMLGHLGSYIYKLAILDDHYKYIYDAEAGTSTLFDLKNDPDEDRNYYGLDPKIDRKFDTLRLAHAAKGFLDYMKRKQQRPSSNSLPEIDEDPEVTEQLRALGYVD